MRSRANAQAEQRKQHDRFRQLRNTPLGTRPLGGARRRPGGGELPTAVPQPTLGLIYKEQLLFSSNPKTQIASNALGKNGTNFKQHPLGLTGPLPDMATSLSSHHSHAFDTVRDMHHHSNGPSRSGR